MKNLLLFGSGFIALSLFSCKKQYTCECEINTSVTNFFTGEKTITKSTSSSTSELKKKDSEAWCESNEISTNSILGSTSSKCNLK